MEPFSIEQDTKLSSDFLEMFLNGSETDSNMAQNSSDSVGMNFNLILLPELSLAKVSDGYSLRANQIYSEPFWNLFPNQSEKRFVSRLMKNGQESIRINLNQVSNQNQSEVRMI